MSFAFDRISGLWFGDINSRNAGPTTGSALPTSFVVRRGFEGPQIYVEWNLPVATGLVTNMVLVRRLFGFPRTYTDPLATIVWQGSVQAKTVSDLNVVAGTCYYYKLFIAINDGTVISSTDLQGFAIVLPTGYFAEKLWALLPEFFKNADKRKDLNGATRLALIQGVGSTAEVFNLGEDGTVLKGQLRRLFKIYGPLFDEAKGLIDSLIDQLDFDKSTLPNLGFLSQTLGLDLNTELSPEKMRNEARAQIDYLKIKGTKPGLIARLRSVSDADPTISEQYNNILFANDPTRTSLKFTAAEVQGISSPNDIIDRSVGYPDKAPFWLWFNVFMNSPDNIALDEVTVRKFCIAMNESAPVCHRGDLYVTGTTNDAVSVEMTDSQLDDEAEEDDDTMIVSLEDSISDQAVYDTTKVLIYSDNTKTFNAPNFGAVFPGVSYSYLHPPTSD